MNPMMMVGLGAIVAYLLVVKKTTTQPKPAPPQQTGCPPCAPCGPTVPQPVHPIPVDIPPTFHNPAPTPVTTPFVCAGLDAGIDPKLCQQIQQALTSNNVQTVCSTMNQVDGTKFPIAFGKLALLCRQLSPPR